MQQQTGFAGGSLGLPLVQPLQCSRGRGEVGTCPPGRHRLRPDVVFGAGGTGGSPHMQGNGTRGGETGTEQHGGAGHWLALPPPLWRSGQCAAGSLCPLFAVVYLLSETRTLNCSPCLCGWETCTVAAPHSHLFALLPPRLLVGTLPPPPPLPCSPVPPVISFNVVRHAVAGCETCTPPPSYSAAKVSC